MIYRMKVSTDGAEKTSQGKLGQGVDNLNLIIRCEKFLHRAVFTEGIPVGSFSVTVTPKRSGRSREQEIICGNRSLFCRDGLPIYRSICMRSVFLFRGVPSSFRLSAAFDTVSVPFPEPQCLQLTMDSRF